MSLLIRNTKEGALTKRMDGQSKLGIVFGVIALASFAIFVTTYILTLRWRRPLRAVPTTNDPLPDKLPSLFSWKNFRKRPRRDGYSTTLQDTEYRGSTGRESREMSGAAADPERQDSSARAAGVDRNTSVRSVMTLPAYSPAVRDNERVLAREGERGGIDSVVELPETLDEEEQQRDEEMESLYQIRLARRIEAADREARRQARRDARARGDVQALTDLRRAADEAADLSVSQILIAEHQNRVRNRERRVSSVAYGDLGVARHDGTRLRANSSESDHRPLLDNAASISGQSSQSRRYTNNTLDLADSHQRGLSVTSISPSVDSEYDFADASRTNSRANDHSDDFEVVPLHPERSYGSSGAPSPQLEIPPGEAPAYEDPPNYESPVNSRAPQLPSIDILPSIQVTTEPTPVEERSQHSLR